MCSIRNALLKNSQSLSKISLNCLLTDGLIQLLMVHQQDWKCTCVEAYADKIRAMHPAARCLFGEVEALVKLLMTIPCSNAEAERSFSCLRRVKSYLRNRMEQERLNHVAVLTIHRERLDSVNTTLIAKTSSRKKISDAKFLDTSQARILNILFQY